MTILQAFFLGVIQGLTEFIPVSSTAHLMIAEKLLGIPFDDRTFAFSVIIQLGTVIAMLAFFWKDIWQIAKAFFLGDTFIAAALAAKEAFPGRKSFVLRIGHDAAFHIGGATS